MLMLVQKQNTARRSNTHEFFLFIYFTLNKIFFLSNSSEKYETRCSFLSKVTLSTKYISELLIITLCDHYQCTL